MTTTPTPLPGNLQWLGLAKETTYGTAVSVPTVWIPVDSPKYARKTSALKDQALRGVMSTTFGQVQGMSYTELGYKTYVYGDSVFQHFLAALGGTDTVSGTTAPYTHKASVYNTTDATHQAQPTSWTGFLYQADGKVKQIPGLVLADLKLTIKANETPTLDVQWQGMPSTDITAPTNTPSTSQMMPPWTASVNIGGSQANQYTGVTVDIKRNTKPVPVLNGSQSPLGIYGGPVTVTGTFDAVYQGTTDYDLGAFIANTQPALSVSIYSQGDATHPLTLQMSKVAYDSADPQPSNTDWLTIQSAWEAISNATDALDAKLSPIQVSLLNTVVTAF
jgi:hypothetical protein